MNNVFQSVNRKMTRLTYGAIPGDHGQSAVVNLERKSLITLI